MNNLHLQMGKPRGGPGLFSFCYQFSNLGKFVCHIELIFRADF
jgi:hypothetical protein